MSYNIHKLLALAEKFEKATKSLDKKKDKDKDKSGPKKRFPFWLKFKKKKVKSSLFDDLLLKYSDFSYKKNLTPTLDPNPVPDTGVIPLSTPVNSDSLPWGGKTTKSPDISNAPRTQQQLLNEYYIDHDPYQKPPSENEWYIDHDFYREKYPFIDDNKKNKSVDAPNKYKSIDPKFQKLLGLNPDGILGPVTRSALDNYKKSIGQDNASDEIAFIGMKNEPAYQAGTALVYDDNQNVYLSNLLDKKYKTNLPARKNPY
tara:strand:- start:17426 stop:18199 length:774 start_codon:yes stop_codon:yes gene_type:complete